jgi:hypothetical protein
VVSSDGGEGSLNGEGMQAGWQVEQLMLKVNL